MIARSWRASWLFLKESPAFPAIFAVILANESRAAGQRRRALAAWPADENFVGYQDQEPDLAPSSLLLAPAKLTVSEAIAKADDLYNLESIPFEKEFALLSEAYKSAPFNPELSWRLCRSYYHMATEVFSANVEEKKKCLDAALEVAKQAVKEAPNHWGGHKWAAITLGTLGDLLSTKEKIGNSFLIKDYLVAAEKLAPEDATIKVALGKWCYAVASIGFVERNLAAVLFASPPESSYDEAISYLMAANEIVQKDLKIWKATEAPTYITIARCYEGKGDKEKAKEWYNKVLAVKADSKAIQADKAVAKERVASLSSSWW